MDDRHENCKDKLEGVGKSSAGLVKDENLPPSKGVGHPDWR
jgi:hypothetical protein